MQNPDNHQSVVRFLKRKDERRQNKTQFHLLVNLRRFKLNKILARVNVKPEEDPNNANGEIEAPILVLIA
jgi:ribonuclease G